MAKHRALGKGLGALIPGTEDPGDYTQNISGDSTSVNRLSIDLIEPNPAQPRKDINEEGINALALSLKEHGIVQPLVVRRMQQNVNKYQIVAGERRWRAARIADIDEIPVRIFEGSDSDAMEISLVENIQREDLSPLEVSHAIQQLVDEFNITQEEVSKRLGWSRTAVTNKLRLLNLTGEVKGLLSQSSISEGHARTLLSLHNEQDQIYLARQCVAKMWSVRQLEEKVRETNNVNSFTAHKTPAPLDLPGYIQDISNKNGILFRVSGKPGKRRLAMTGLNDKQIADLFEMIKKHENNLFPGK